MIRIENYKLGGHFPCYTVSMTGEETAQAIFFNHNFALVYAHALSEKYEEHPILDCTDLGTKVV